MHRSLPADRRPSAAPSTSGTDHRVGGRLRSDWERLRRDPDALARADAWRIVPHPVLDLDEVLAAVGYVAGGGVERRPEHEIELRHLVTTAAIDPLAGRVVLQRILPALVARARRHPAPTEVALDELVGVAWIAITTFDPRRQPTSLAAALVGDAVHRAFRAPMRRRMSTEAVASIDDAVAGPGEAAADTGDELDAVFRIGRIGGVAEADLAFLRRLLVADRTEDLAAELQVTSRTLRNRRTRITDQLRELAA